jgi:hypothetical protein
VLQLLLADGRADPAARKSSALRHASRRGFFGCVHTLLNDGRADPGARGCEALREATRAGHADIVRVLLKDGRVDPGMVHATWWCPSNMLPTINAVVRWRRRQRWLRVGAGLVVLA